MNEERLLRIEEDISEIKNSQRTIIQALLGSIDNNQVGIIEETRHLKREVLELKETTEIHTEQIKDLSEFQTSAKRIVWAAGLSIPVIWEFIKFLANSTFDVFRGK